jgi:hypothetical protein
MKPLIFGIFYQAFCMVVKHGILLWLGSIDSDFINKALKKYLYLLGIK